MSEFDDKIFAAWRSCWIFFFTIQYGWGKVTRLTKSSVVARNPPVSSMRRLGYPSRGMIWRAMKQVRDTAPRETELYKSTFREWTEARERFQATKEYYLWKRYLSEGKMSVRYQSHVAVLRRDGVRRYRKRYKYLADELLSQNKERERARAEMREADRVLREMKEKIFDLMGVPAEYRKLTL